MRKFQQMQILELLQTLSEANDEINRLLSYREYRNAIQILADSQEFAASICEYIENIEGEGISTVELLEKYCKSLYDASLKINGKNGINNLYKFLQKQLLRIKNSVQNDLKPDKIEVAFFPYKASMFDSLESIWSAAKNDSKCDAYMVPIPYYERLSNGSFGQMYYEGEQYSKDIPITDWKEYNPAIRHPDIIFICSPYDDGNYVTSVHPDFYSKKLKDLTGCLLVYVPYFVCIDDIDENLCVCAGTLYADIVIVQSEKIRQTYIRAFKKFEKDNNCTGKFGNPEEKFIALGSPKFDKIMSVKSEDFIIPDEWERLINKPDGTQKKVIFYNTSISMLLHGNELYLKKIRYVLNIFRNRTDVVLLWRPHPLNETVYQAMRPHLLYEYERIVTEYKREGWGIYDDTADLHRAIAISDSYYGDGGSVAALYQYTGKFIMFQNLHIESALAFENLYDDGEHLWFTSFNSSALYRMDKLAWEAEYMGSFPNNEPPDRWRLYSSITGHGNDLYFAPIFADKIMKFNRLDKTFEEIPFTFKNADGSAWNSNEAKFCSSVSYGQWIFFFSANFPAFLRYDTISGRIDSFSDWLKEVKKLKTNEERPFWKYAKSVCVLGPSVFICVSNTNAVVEFDMDSCTSKVYEVGARDNKYSTICFDGCDFWISPFRDTPIIRWNLEDNTAREYNLPSGFLSGSLSFWGINYSNGYVWLLPHKANMALRVNIKSDCVEIAEDFQNECSHEEEGSFTPQIYIFSKVVDNLIYAHTGRSNRFIVYDCANGHKIEKTIEPVLKTLEYLKESFMLKTIGDSLYDENNILALKRFIDYIILEDINKNAEALKNRQRAIGVKGNVNMDGNAGSAIYHFCKESINFKVGL